MADSEQPSSAPISAGALLAGFVRDGWFSLCFLLGWRPSRSDARAAVARGALFFPLLGAAGGALVAELLSILDPQTFFARGILPVLFLALLTGGRPALDLVRVVGGGFFGVAVLGIFLAAEVWAFGPLEGNLRTIALVLAPMLGRWAYVVQAYGSLPARPDGFAAVMVRHMEFTQFATASVCAMALSLILINALGTLVLFVVASVTILLRVWAHRRRGGVSAISLGAGSLVAEAMVVVLVGVVARVAAGSS